jgi:hypothetical protein
MRWNAIAPRMIRKVELDNSATGSNAYVPEGRSPGTKNDRPRGKHEQGHHQ